MYLRQRDSSKSCRVQCHEYVLLFVPLEDLFYCCSLVNAYGLNGKGAQALELFHRMPSDLFDEVTYVCVLNACSHSGLVDQAYVIFRGIVNPTDTAFCTMVSRVA